MTLHAELLRLIPDDSRASAWESALDAQAIFDPKGIVNPGKILR